MLPLNPVAGTPLSLDISPEVIAALDDGVYQIGYGAQRFVGGTPNDSNTTPIIIDRTPPGGESLAPISFPAETHDGLNAAEFEAMGDQLVGQVPVYFDIKWGDVIQTWWAGQPGPVYTVQAHEVANPSIAVNFDRALLDGLEDGPVAVTYTVIDRAGNVSVMSQATQLLLQLKNHPTDLLPPQVPQAADGLIDNADGRLGVLVHVPAYTHAQAGDAITLLWGDVRLPEQPLSESQASQPLLCSFTVAYAELTTAGDGEKQVRYEVRRNGQLLATSPALAVQVWMSLPGPQDESPQTLVTEALAAPIIKGKSDNPNHTDNVLDADDYLLSADAVIAWSEQFQPCDQINLFWGSATVPITRPITQNDLQSAAALVINLPNSLITSEGACKPVGVYYTVTHAGNPNTSYSPRQNVQLIAPGQLPGAGAGLPAPLFSQADAHNCLELLGSPDGTWVLVKPYRNQQPGDVLTLSFNGFDAQSGGQPVAAADFSQRLTLDEEALLKGCSFKVPGAALQAIYLGRAEARYEVSNPQGRVRSQKADAYVDRRTPAPICK